ncbi:TolC family protein [Nitrosomonas sp. Is37]|uniref:TolC family protein n=1 Tax=Nitrosomonas sp. Is37 TaxID=3080535 RepID=UPI00294B60BC|nr:TolC family protein [Nitrosomonas sp. Is37]MDV6343541.1 TolC family protein [Nitrosomonas sp. Is37]
MKIKLWCKPRWYFLAHKTQILILILIISNYSFQVTASNDLINKNPEKSLSYHSSLFSAGKNDLTLRDAVNLALHHNPELAAFAKEKDALEGTTQQAGLFKNPELSVNVENVGNIQKLTGDINSPQAVSQEVVQQITTIRISQLFELGGKRAARTAAALLNEELANKDYETRRIEIIARVANVYTDVLAGQERLKLAEGSMQLAQNVVNTVIKRVQAGKVPPIEETRAKIGLSTTRIELEQAQRDLVAARKRLALLWGDPSPQFNQALGNLESVTPLPSVEKLEERVLGSPAALRALKNIEQRKALLEVEKTRRIPNLIVNAGVVHHAQLGGNTAVAGLAIPLPLFDRNQGNLKEAHQRVNKAMDEKAATELRLKTELAQAYEVLSAVWNEINILRDEILPGARSAFEVTKKGYELGRFGFLELLDSQRILFQNQVLYVRALANYQRLVNEIERLIAAPIDELSDMSSTRHSGDNEEYKE